MEDQHVDNVGGDLEDHSRSVVFMSHVPISETRIVSLLPPGFKLRHPSSFDNMVIPSEHQILLHCSANEKECYFIAVSSSPGFGIEKPYVIYLLCEPGLQLSLGFFIDPKTLRFVDFLPLREGKAILEEFAVIDRLKKEVHITITKCLEVKGLNSLSGVLHLLELDASRPHLDTKCFEKYCWYCIERCCVCLKPAGSDYSSVSSTGRILRYCSAECCKCLTEANALSLVVAKPGDFVPGKKSNADTVKVRVCGSAILSSTPNIPAIFNTNFLMYIRKVLEKDHEYFYLSIFHSTRSHHVQTFTWFNEFSSLSEVLALIGASTGDYKHLKYIVSLILNTFPQHESDQSLMHFYNSLFLLRDLPYFLTSSSGYLLLPLLEVHILDTKNLPLVKSVSSEASASRRSNSPEVVKTVDVTEYQYLYLNEIVPPDYTIAFKFIGKIKEVKFSSHGDDELDEAFSNVVNDICAMLAIRFNSISMLDKKGENEKLYEYLNQLNKRFEMCLQRLPTQLKKFAAENFATMILFINNLKTIITTIYTGLNQGLSAVASECLLSTLSILGLCCFYSSSWRNVILSQTDILQQLSCQLQELKDIKQVDQFIIDLTVASLNVIRGLCLHSKYYWQIMEEKIPEIILSYYDSPLFEVSVAAKISISALYCILRPKLVKQIFPTEIMIDKLNEMQISDTIMVIPKGFCNLLNTLMYLSSLFSSDIISPFIETSANFLPAALKVISSTFQLSKDYELEKEIALSVAFKLALLNKSFIDYNEEAVAQILSLSGNQPSTLQAIASCILWKFGDEDIIDLPNNYTDVCYDMNCYTESLSKCEEILKCNSNQGKSCLQLMKAKSLFQIFIKEVVILKQQKGKIEEKSYRSQRFNCYAKAKQCIDTFGTLLDKGDLDDEGSQLLDLSMIHYVYETNDLRSCQRCLLCRKVGKLQRSHIWPRALLQEISDGVEVPETKKSYIVSWQPQNRFWSPKEITFFLFCASCEHLLNQYGETQFVPQFFRKVYNISCSLKEIVYGPWLYQFCIGIIFRGLLNPALTKFVNDDEIYSLLKFCRKFLLSLSTSLSDDCSSYPLIYIFLNQVASDKKSEDPNNRLLSLRSFFGVEEIDLFDGKITTPRSAQYFLAHFGNVNILTKFKVSTYELNSAYKILSNGGFYKVPANSQRQHLIPPGVWAVLNQLTDFKHIDYQFLGDQENVDIVSEQKDLSSMLLQIQLFASSPKTLSFLPKGFVVQRSDNQPCVELPLHNRVLLHYFIKISGNSEETLFLCAKSGIEVPIQMYVIYHYFKGGFELVAGFNISSDDLTAQEFLPESQNVPALSKISQIFVFRQYIHKMLPKILQEKGFLSSRSLFHRIHHGNEGSVDMRCQSLSRCWYCLDRCDFCMKLVSFGCTRKVIRSISTQFCSSCKDIAKERGTIDAKVSHVKPEDHPLPLAISPLSLSHRSLFSARCTATVAGIPFLYEFVLCTAKDSEDLPVLAPYVTYHHWNLSTQLFLEFTVTPKMSPDEPVIYTEGEGSVSAILQLRNMPIQKLLVQAIQAYNVVL